jgi:hypothetical protein
LVDAAFSRPNLCSMNIDIFVYSIH